MIGSRSRRPSAAVRQKKGKAMMWIAVGIGGALGCMARHAVGVVTTRVIGVAAPYATAIVNVTGCAAVGVLAGLVASGRWPMTDTLRAFVFVGILGGFTTFSSFGLDTFTLARSGALNAAMANALGQLVVGLLAVYGGYRLAV
jgi:CrcB protein